MHDLKLLCREGPSWRLVCCPMENNIVFVVDCCSELRHYRLASLMAAVLTMETRLLDYDCNRDLEIVRNRQCMGGLMMLLELVIAILLLLAGEALIAMRLKTFLLVQLCAQDEQ